LTSIKPKAQRKSYSKQATRVRTIRAPLSADLRKQYSMRTVQVRKGDSVSVVRGDYKGHEGKVIGVFCSEMRITVDGVTMPKMDGTKKPVMLLPSKVKVMKLDLSDKVRKGSLEGSKKSKR